LSIFSPCINAGDPCYVGEPGETDIDGDSRVVAGCVDMGADEFVDMGLEVKVRITPRVLHPRSRGTWVKALLRFPEGIRKGDIDLGRPLRMEPGGIEAVDVKALGKGKKRLTLRALFRRADVNKIEERGRVELTLRGELVNGDYFYGKDHIWILRRPGELLEQLAERWLKGCGSPDWCGGLDVDQNGIVNMIDFYRAMSPE